MRLNYFTFVWLALSQCAIAILDLMPPEIQQQVAGKLEPANLKQFKETSRGMRDQALAVEKQRMSSHVQRGLSTWYKAAVMAIHENMSMDLIVFAVENGDFRPHDIDRLWVKCHVFSNTRCITYLKDNAVVSDRAKSIVSNPHEYARECNRLVELSMSADRDIQIPDDALTIDCIDPANDASVIETALFHPYHQLHRALKLIELGAFLNRQSQSDGMTLLHTAVRDGRADALDILLKNGANPYLIVTLGVTAFEFALCDRIEFAPIFIRNGYDINYQHPDNGLTALHIVLRSSCPIPGLNYLITTGADHLKRDKDGNTPLQEGFGFSSASRYEALVFYLNRLTGLYPEELKKKILFSRNDIGETLLYNAARSGSRRMLGLAISIHNHFGVSWKTIHNKKGETVERVIATLARKKPGIFHRLHDSILLERVGG